VSDPVETTPAPRDSDAQLADQIEASFDAKRKELGVADELKDILGVTTLSLPCLSASRSFSLQGRTSSSSVQALRCW
jgi:hypothetical protein